MANSVLSGEKARSRMFSSCTSPRRLGSFSQCRATLTTLLGSELELSNAFPCLPGNQRDQMSTTKTPKTSSPATAAATIHHPCGRLRSRWSAGALDRVVGKAAGERVDNLVGGSGGAPPVSDAVEGSAATTTRVAASGGSSSVANGSKAAAASAGV